MLIANEHNSKLLTATLPIGNNEFLAELNAYNQETMLLSQASRVISKTGEDLDNLLKAGTENLSQDEQRVYMKRLKDFEAFIAQFQARVAAQIAREKGLKAKAKTLGVSIDFPALSPLGTN